MLNQSGDFLALKREDPEEVRFYNKRSIVRVEYEEEEAAQEEGVTPLECVVHMMDGSLISGTIRRFLPPEKSRLYDYLNLTDEPFTKLYLEENQVCLINKSYIVRVCPMDSNE